MRVNSPTNPTEDGLIEAAGRIARNILDAYERSPVLRMLVKLCPPLAVAETGILGTYAWFQHRRLEVFADEFTTLGLQIREEDAVKKEFFDAYTSTARHVLSESRDAKICMFARLFGTFVKSGCSTSIDRYEEYLLLLDEISEREFSLLLLLARHERNHPQESSENRLQRAMHYWRDFVHDADSELGIEGDALEAMLTRLTRTGMYHEITGGFWDYTGGVGYLTTTFESFLEEINISPGSDKRSAASPAPSDASDNSV